MTAIHRSGLGPVMLDLAGPEVTAEERELLRHPATGGVILFTRNYRSPEQLCRLTAAIHEVRDPPLLIAVDQEGGRVQRFRAPFFELPPAARFGALYQTSPDAAVALAAQAAWLMASELIACGLDFSFAPVLDLDRGISSVIGDRAFGEGAATVIALAGGWLRGARDAGMASVGKHFPGHGGVAADSHHELPVDHRTLKDIEQEDLRPFAALAAAGLDAVMPAHVLYPAVDDLPAGFSRRWIGEVLRGQLGFQGAVFSDDLSMVGATGIGAAADRAEAALAAGCDMLLICNNSDDAAALLDANLPPLSMAAAERLNRLRASSGAGRRAGDGWTALHRDRRWQSAVTDVARVVDMTDSDWG